MLFPRKRKEVGDKICAQILLLIRQTNPFGVCYRSGVAYLTLSHTQDLNINPLLNTSLFRMYGYCKEILLVNHYWEGKISRERSESASTESGC